jgi:hypothetical protein
MASAKLYEGNDEKKTDLLCKALKVYIFLRRSQGKYADAAIYAEELITFSLLPIILCIQRYK